MAVSYSYMRDIILGGMRDMHDHINYQNAPNYSLNQIHPNYLTGGLNNGLLGPLPFSQEAQILSELAALRQMLHQALQLAMHPPLMITSSEKLLPMHVSEDAAKAIAAGKFETPVERVGSDVNSEATGVGVALMSTAHPCERIDWEKDGAKDKDLWPDIFGDISEYAEKAEAAIEAEFALMKKNGDEMARAVSRLGHAADGMPPRFIPQLD